MARYSPKPPKKSNATGFFILAAVTALSIGIIGSYYQFRFKNNMGAGGFKSEPVTANNLEPTKPLDNIATTLPTPIAAKPNDENYALKDLKALPLPATLPDLLGSDTSFRAALTAISPGLAPWLAIDQLIRKFLVIVNDFSQGIRVSSHLSFLRLEQPFAIEQTEIGTFISERSYHRYDKLAEAIQAINPKALALVYQTYRPLFLQVFAEFSYPKDITLETTVKKVAADVLAAPIIQGPVELVRPSLFYKFADPSLESLSSPQKQMIRMGPDNTRIIQAKLREFMVEFAKLNFP